MAGADPESGEAVTRVPEKSTILLAVVTRVVTQKCNDDGQTAVSNSKDVVLYTLLHNRGTRSSAPIVRSFTQHRMYTFSGRRWRCSASWR